MSNVLEILSKLVGIVTGLITIAKACRNYIADRKSSKKTHQPACQHLMGQRTITI